MAIPILTAASYALKTYVVAKTACDMYRTYEDPELSSWEKTHQMGTKGLFIGMQLIDGGVTSHLFGAVPHAAEVTCRVFTAATHLAKTASNLSVQDTVDCQDMMEAVGTAAFRATDIGELVPEIAGNMQVLEEIGEGAIATATLYNARHKIHSAGQKVAKMASSCLAENPENIENNQEQSLEDRNYAEELNEIRFAGSISDFSKVPDHPFFSKDPILCRWQCPISKRPIRFIVVIESTKKTNHPIFYEKEAIEKFFSEHPGSRPPAWPRRISVRSYKLEAHTGIQSLINNRLTQLFREAQESIRDGECDPFYGENL
ncbi:MAG TPA: hypothetical protein VJK48_02580 [Chlamydiales bacterium]|nr:MAG: hypothetical protein A3F67_11875 [Verrucomicrobia bacterium RIFCSPHIGHO2_12_FULL_41_10]HLB52579.1 hypothetical protein [Chlamydiales bacterium]